MFNHEPNDYRCPICVIVSGGATEKHSQDDVVRRFGGATALVAPHWWPRNPGHVLVVPDAHHENLYDLPSGCGHAIHDLVREVAIALRTIHACAGTSTRQHNEPAGGQSVWHFHVHVFPRWPGDNLYRSEPSGLVPTERRREMAAALRSYWSDGA